MRRRTFATLLSGAVLVWCTHSYAQPPDKVHRAAVISPSETAIENWRTMMIPELAGLGFTEGRNLVVTFHIGLPIRMPELAREALAHAPTSWSPPRMSPSVRSKLPPQAFPS